MRLKSPVPIQNEMVHTFPIHHLKLGRCGESETFTTLSGSNFSDDAFLNLVKRKVNSKLSDILKEADG